MYSTRTVLGILITNFFLTWTTVTLRCWVRIAIVRKFWWDDFLACAAVVIVTTAFGLYLHGVYRGGIGTQLTSATDLQKYVLGLRDLQIDGLLYAAGTCCIKVSFALTLLRVLRQRGQRWVVIAMLVLVICVSAVYFFFNLFKCTPIKYNWTMVMDPYVVVLFLGGDPAKAGIKPKGYCASFTASKNIVYAHSTMMVILDITLGVILPYLVLRNLNMKGGLKFTAGVLLGLGSIASIATIIRIIYVKDLVGINGINAANALFVWSDIEFALCVIATSCATYKPLFIKLREQSSAFRSGYNTYGTDLTSRSRSVRKIRTWLYPGATTAMRSTVDVELAPLDRDRIWAGPHTLDPSGNIGLRNVIEAKNRNIITTRTDEPGEIRWSAVDIQGISRTVDMYQKIEDAQDTSAK